MRTRQIQPSLFAWENLEDTPSIKPIRRLLESVPDGDLLSMLSSYRGRGRNDSPVHVLWGALLLNGFVAQIGRGAQFPLSHGRFSCLQGASSACLAGS